VVPDDKQLEREAGVRASVIDEGIEEQTEDGIEKSEKHDGCGVPKVHPNSAAYRRGVSKAPRRKRTTT